MMAKAYSRASKNYGVLMVTSGPAGTNSMTGVAIRNCPLSESVVLWTSILITLFSSEGRLPESLVYRLVCLKRECIADKAPLAESFLSHRDFPQNIMTLHLP